MIRDRVRRRFLTLPADDRPCRLKLCRLVAAHIVDRRPLVWVRRPPALTIPTVHVTLVLILALRLLQRLGDEIDICRGNAAERSTCTVLSHAVAVTWHFL